MKKLKQILFWSQIFMVCTFSGKAQISQLDNNGITGSSAQFVGWDNNATYALRIKNEAAYSIEFWTNTVKQMEIDGVTGNVGIGPFLLGVPAGFKLSVDNDINLITSTWGHGYWIGQELVFSTPGIENTLVGVGAGNPVSAAGYQAAVAVGYKSGFNLSTGAVNTFVGTFSGYLNTTGDGNTFVGATAGYNNTSGSWNTFVGRMAGNLHQTGNYNTFVGESAGIANVIGENNTFLGHHSAPNNNGNDNTIIGYHAADNSVNDNQNVIVGYNAAYHLNGGARNVIIGTSAGQEYQQGDETVAIGYFAGFHNSNGNSNVFLGKGSGYYNYNGQLNTYLGFMSGPPNPSYQNLTNAAAVGNNTIVLHNNDFILGNNTMNVGIGLSGNTTGPQSKLEINDGTTGVSGLQFRTLTSSYVPTGAPESKFLTVDANGKVVLKDVVGGGGSVSACTGLSSADVFYVPKWSTISTSSKELCKSQIYDNTVNVGIANSFPNQKLDVDGNINVTQKVGSYYINNDRFLGSGGNGKTSSIELGHGAGPSSSLQNGYGNIMIGLKTGSNLSSDESSNILIGSESGTLLQGSFSSAEANRNVLIGTKSGSNLTTGDANTFIGHWAGGSYSGLDRGSRNSFLGALAGYYAKDQGDENLLLGYNTHLDVVNGNLIVSSAAIGPYSWVGSDNTLVIGREASTVLMGYNTIPSVIAGCKLYVTGNGDDVAYFNGNTYNMGNFYPSDRNLKSNIEQLGDSTAISIIQHLNPSKYTYDQANHPNLTLPSGQQYGLIADELELVLPQLVKQFTSPDKYDSIGNLINSSETFKAINYVGLIPLMVKTIQAEKLKEDSLTMVLNDLTTRLNELETRIQTCCSSTGATHRQIKSVELINTIILDQNSPNPFAEETKITFTIPESIVDAKILFYDNSGKVLKTISIEERGEGYLQVYAANLSSGIYSYSLLADGKLIDTKRMVCEKN